MWVIGNIFSESILLQYPLASGLPPVMYAGEILDGIYKNYYATTGENISVYNNSIKWFNKETKP